MDVKQAFLDWTYHTVPYEKEDKYLKKLIPSYFKKDMAGNYYHIIGNSTTMFTAHLDTVGGDKPVKHVIEKGFIKTDGKSILGADDKAGVVIMLYMIEHNVPGFYLFPVGEEVGCQGSGRLTKYLLENSKKSKITITDKNNKQTQVEIDVPKDPIYGKITKVISFDRRGYTNIITHQMDQRCCSDNFANGLAKELNKHGFGYEADDSGLYSDSAEFADIYPECTNLSVGYFAQHTEHETQDIEFLESLCKACVKVNWEKLPVSRNPKDIEYVDNYYNYWGGRGSGKNKSGYNTRHNYIYDDESDQTPSEYMKDKEKDVRTVFFFDDEYKYVSNVSFIDDKLVDIDISADRIRKELNMIEELLDKFDVDYDDIYWDGLVLVIESQKMDTKMIRSELIEFIPELALENIDGYLEGEEEEEEEVSVK